MSSAKSYFNEMMEEVAKGREYFILSHGKPVAQILPIREDMLTRPEIVERLFSFQTLKSRSSGEYKGGEAQGEDPGYNGNEAL